MSLYLIEFPHDILSAYCREHHIRTLSFFGSVTREDFREDSDIDVLVAFEPGARNGFLVLTKVQRELSDLLARPVDLVPESGLKPIIRDEVLNSAEVVYAV